MAHRGAGQAPAVDPMSLTRRLFRRESPMRAARYSGGSGRQGAVSFDEESLILVDEHDTVLGFDSKQNVHRQGGRLHRAFSIFLFAGSGRVLLHRRSRDKLLWPAYWTNSCCSHPRRGETLGGAARRRLGEELGVSAHLHCLYRFQYTASFGDVGTERELCSVLLGNVDEALPVRPHRGEVMDWGWFDCSAVDHWLRRSPERFTPWFQLEWARLRGDLWPRVARLCRWRQRRPIDLVSPSPGAAPAIEG
jgi:isopentenyl-diphosphate Delta-isomerase